MWVTVAYTTLKHPELFRWYVVSVKCRPRHILLHRAGVQVRCQWRLPCGAATQVSRGMLTLSGRH